MNPGFGHFRQSSQRGIALITVILMLLVLTVIALLAMALPAIQTRVAANTANAQIAFATSDGTARVAQTVLSGAIPDYWTTTTNPNRFYKTSNIHGLYFFDPALVSWLTSVTDPMSHQWIGSKVQTTPFSGGSSAPGQYIAEELHPTSPAGVGIQTSLYGGHAQRNPRVIRVTARAVGASGQTVELVQGTYQTSF